MTDQKDEQEDKQVQMDFSKEGKSNYLLSAKKNDDLEDIYKRCVRVVWVVLSFLLCVRLCVSVCVGVLK